MASPCGPLRGFALNAAMIRIDGLTQIPFRLHGVPISDPSTEYQVSLLAIDYGVC